jgi:hypothetical protein
MSLRSCGIVFLISAIVDSEGSAVLLQRAQRRASNSVGALVGFQYSPSDPAARTLLALDKNSDGRIDPAEIAAFATLQGMDATAAAKEFSSIDMNNDGVLDSAELQRVFGAPAAPQVAVSVPAAPSSVAPTQLNPVQPVDANGILSTDAALSAIIAEPTLPQLQAPSTANAILADTSRDSAQRAAQQVTEQLKIEQSEEQQAREFDRKAMDLLASSNALAKATVQAATDASSKAATKKTQEIMTQIAKLDTQMEKAELTSAALHAKSKMEQEQANALMNAADQALSHS